MHDFRRYRRYLVWSDLSWQARHIECNYIQDAWIFMHYFHNGEKEVFFNVLNYLKKNN